MPAPIALFVYNRPDHTLKTIEALSKNKGASESLIYVFCDGPKSDASLDEIKKIEETRELFDHLKGFKKVEIIKQPKNKGLADSIVDGVTEILRIHDAIIVLEDDIVTSPFFLEYMNWALEEYQHEEKVMHVSAYWYPMRKNHKLPDLFFTNMATCWGWGTWRKNWSSFSRNHEEVKRWQLNGILDSLDGDFVGDFSRQLKRNLNGEIKTWAIFWYASIVANKGLSLHPNHSFTNNIGHDNTGENSFETNVFTWAELSEKNRFEPTRLKINDKALEYYFDFIKNLYSRSLMQRIKSKLLHLTRSWS